MTPASPVGGEDVARLRAQRDRAIGPCGYTVVVEGEEEPCNREATGWRWYQGHDHEDLLDVACIHHENQGGALMVALLDRLEAAESARDEALAVAYDDGYNDAATMARIYGHTDHWPDDAEPRNPYRAALTPSAPTEESQA